MDNKAPVSTPSNRESSVASQRCSSSGKQLTTVDERRRNRASEEPSRVNCLTFNRKRNLTVFTSLCFKQLF